MIANVDKKENEIWTRATQGCISHGTAGNDMTLWLFVGVEDLLSTSEAVRQ